MDLKPRCKKCNKPIDIDNMRALPNQEGFECKDCNASNKNKLNQKKETIIPFASEKNFFMKRELVCKSCNYRFSRKADEVVRKCPYCGRETVVDFIDETADDLIKKN